MNNDLFSETDLTNEELFKQIFNARDEEELISVINKYEDVFEDGNWKPLGDNDSNYGIVKNQQSNPIAALIEKVTNSIDALLTKKCYEAGVDPKSKDAPQSMNEAIYKFYPNTNWDLQEFRRKQAEEIQIIADGKGPKSKKTPYDTSVIVYDDGEGQHPHDFERTFLSLVRGNKNDVQFVQGKYNMGGSGSIVFCGKRRYQLIASRKYDKKGDFGFTLIREHPKRKTDKSKETWFEYLLIDGKIPSFKIDKLKLGLENRKFESGSIIKMYSYQFPKGYSGFAQDLNQSINEYLFNPALPLLTKDTEKRYPNNNVLVNDLFGLKRRLSKEENDYLAESFSEVHTDSRIGPMKVSCYVFKTKVRDNDLKKTKENIQKRYFKNNMSVLFSLNGQVHGHYTSEFITRSLKMNMLKSHLLIHVDCTEMNYDFRKELFMASRDRLKDGEETQYLRNYLSKHLSKKGGRLDEIQKFRKQAVNIDSSSNTEDILKDFTKNMPLDSDLMKLLGKTFKLDQTKNKKDNTNKPKKDKKEQKETPFNPQRFPSLFQINGKGNNEVTKIPQGGEKTIRFQTDVEDDYFDRTEDPGDLKISVLGVNSNETEGGTKQGEPKTPTDLFNIVKSSPSKGTIRLTLNPKDELKVGDSVQIKAELSAPDGDLAEIFMVKIADKEKPKDKAPKDDTPDENLGLPQLIFIYETVEEGSESQVSWEAVEEATNESVDYKTVMIPDVEGDALKRIFINMDSTVLKNFKSNIKNLNQEQIDLANKKYYTSVYFHSLFLYTITKNRGYQIRQKDKETDKEEDIDLGTYLKDLFDNYYSIFILNFGGMEEMMHGIGD
ncbi:hypothetical protein [Psychroflexus sediminis]|uniref:Histidine kinase-, DNA gyrase B-, and HSP90-like ATPase n=1 Tax=Psychroflexus sediminis TaxID=470826 RepID=A0A1G7V8G6_9FLAO|nr:hypothetical protein [Psychroflexus sediminis]SDG56112.1 hypothetical protein SAMN04488027_103154 [Psychroflexus sediminis]